MRHTLNLIVTIILVVAGTATAFAQASSSTAELRGQVTDAGGAIIPGAKITLTDQAKGVTRAATTDDAGNYAFIGLLPSTYQLKVEAKGFASDAARVELTVGQQANIPFKLGAGTVQAAIDIVAGAEVVETNRTEQSSTVDARQINNLPINRRNFLDYALLTPGVTDSDNIADASDFRVAQTPQTGLSFGGNNGRGNMVSVDGAETLSATGGVQATISQEAVQEFQVVRNSYSAEFGGASGGVVNIVSRSGANSFHGSAFGLFRDQRFDARNFFDYNPNGKSTFNRQQYGGSVGGPIKQDKTFFFTSVERLSQDRTTFVNLVTDRSIFEPTGLQNTLLGFLSGNPDLASGVSVARTALTTSSLSFPDTVNLFTNASGQFPFNDDQTQFSARLDRNFTDRSSGYLRFNLTDSVFENQAAGALTAVSRGRTVDTFNGGVVGSHNYQFSPTMFNELKLQFSYTRAGFLPNDPIGPELNIEGFGFFGRDIFLPSRSIDRHFDVYDNVTKVMGGHTLKFGGSIFFNRLNTNNETYFGGRFSFQPVIPLASVIQMSPDLSPSFSAVNSYLRACAPAGTPTPSIPAYCGSVGPVLGADVNGNNIADSLDAPINSIQAFNFGLPASFQGGFGDPGALSWTNRYALYVQDTWKVRPNFTFNYGLRYSLHDEPFVIPTYKKDFQPRVGFSWDPRRDGKTVIRGGAGIFTAFLNNSIANVTSELSGTGDPTNIFIVLATPTSAAFGLPTSFAVYQTLLDRGVLGTRPISLSDVSASPLNINPGPGQPLEVRFRLGPNYRSPTTYQASLGVQRDLGAGFSLDLSYLYVRGLHLSRNRDINQIGLSGAANALNPLGGPTFVASNFSNPRRFQDNIYEQTANSFYHGFTMQVQRRFSNNFSVNAHYTLAKSIDEVTDFNSDWSAQNPLNLRLDRSLSSFDQRHRMVLSANFQSPFQGAALKNWVFAPIFVGQSGRPFNLLLGFDANADRRFQSDRPGQAGRNTGIGEPYYSFDLRLGRRFFVKEGRFLEFTFDAFNLFNRANLLGINNILGAGCADPSGDRLAPCTTPGAVPMTEFDMQGRRDRRPTEPLGFTSAADARQMQFGARFNW
jgi:Carboxypeptidase regulatory-like domain/TonB dependent receptor